MSCIIILEMDIDSICSVSASHSLISGEAKQYGHEQSGRLEIYKDPSINIVDVPALSVKPYVLFFDDITQNPDDWRNTALAEYYQKEFIILT